MKTQPEPIDKSTWADGPWQSEPDHVEWKHAGFHCIAHRVPHHGAWCGYVGVPPGHPWHGKGYDEIEAEVHGGLTYADGCRGAICHVPEPGELDDFYWLGFDCSHAWDISPGTDALVRSHGRSPWSDPDMAYRDLAYVTAEVNSLAEQAANAGN